jgi:hypothetical protein
MIIQLDEYKQYLPLNTLQGYNATITEATEIRTLYKWFVKYLGNPLVEAIADGSASEDLLLKVKPALASFTWFEALPFLNLVLTGSGFGIISNPNMAPASSERVRSLAVGLLESANNYLDNLLVYLEANVSTYTTWNQCSLNPGSLLSNADNFEARIQINRSRVTFINLIPFIKQTETLQISNILSPVFLAEIIAGSDLNARPLIEYACAYWAWQRMIQPAKPGAEKYTDAEFLHSQKKLLLPKLSPELAAKTGEAYIMQAKAYIEKNISNYPTYATYAYEAPYQNKAENGFFIT